MDRRNPNWTPLIPVPPSWRSAARAYQSTAQTQAQQQQRIEEGRLATAERGMYDTQAQQQIEQRLEHARFARATSSQAPRPHDLPPAPISFFSPTLRPYEQSRIARPSELPPVPIPYAPRQSPPPPRNPPGFTPPPTLPEQPAASIPRLTWHNPLGVAREAESSQPPPASAAGNNQHFASFALGTREEVQSEDYVSPLTNMYNRAWTRYREAEEQRALSALSTSPPQQDDHSQYFEDSMAALRLEARREMQDVRERSLRLREAIRTMTNPLVEQPVSNEVNPIDVQDSRPPPLTQEQMTANIECRICQEQRIDILLEPCMHVAICHWCYDVMLARVRRYRHDPENGDRRLRCPICRLSVRQGRKVYL